LESLDAIAEAGRSLQATGIANVVISMGEKGVLWLSPKGNWQALPPPVTPRARSAPATLCWPE